MRPPCKGRPLSELYVSYLSYAKQSLSNYTVIDDRICVSKLDLSLKEYIDIKNYICEKEHSRPCKDCPPLLHAAEMLLKQDHIYSLDDIFKTSFPGVTYTAENAKRKLLQLPLVAMRLGEPSSGKSKLVVMEKFPQLNYHSLQKVLKEAWLDSSQ